MGVYLNKDYSRYSDGKFHINKIRILSDSTFVINFYSIETEEQLEYIRKYNCDLFQGYLVSKPVPKEQILKLLN